MLSGGGEVSYSHKFLQVYVKGDLAFVLQRLLKMYFSICIDNTEETK